MIGDRITIHAEQRAQAEEIVAHLLASTFAKPERYSITVAGESGSGKSTIAAAIGEAFERRGKRCVILQQDDYYLLPPMTNDRERRNHADWRGVKEVRLDFLDQQMKAILDGAEDIVKPVSVYAEDCFKQEHLSTRNVDIVIVEGSFVSLLQHAHVRVFIDRSYIDTRAFREQRARDAAELDAFTESILEIEHEIIAAHKPLADVIVTKEGKIAYQQK